MRKYVLQRLLWLIFILVSVAVIIFTIMYFVPGDPATLILGEASTVEEREAYNIAHGLNDPYIIQLGRYLKETFLEFDFGISYVYKTPVIKEFLSRLPRTFTLAIICIIIDVAIGIPVGIFCALKRNTIADHTVMGITIFGISAPNFWVALMMVILFSKTLGLLPAYGIDGWKSWILPIAANCLAGAGQIARQTRSAVLETIRADFVTTARAKGVSERKVIYRHMLPNALIPVINMVGGQLAGAVAGTVVIESVFSFPGVGTLLMTGINSADYPIVRGCVLIMAAFAAIIMLLVDLLYAYIDPRIKAQYTRQKFGKRREVV